MLVWILNVFIHVQANRSCFAPSGVYSESYDPDLAHCKKTVWNPLGNSLSYEEFDFPIFSMKDDNDTQVIRQVITVQRAQVKGQTDEICPISYLNPLRDRCLFSVSLLN